MRSKTYHDQQTQDDAQSAEKYRNEHIEQVIVDHECQHFQSSSSPYSLSVPYALALAATRLGGVCKEA